MNLLFKLMMRSLGPLAGKQFHLDVTNPAAVTSRGSANLVNTVALEPTLTRIGLGIGGLSYYDGAHAMVNMFQGEANLVDGAYAQLTALDSNKEPTADFQAVIASAPLASGTYKLVFTGKAVLGRLGSCTLENQNYNSGTNTTTCDVVYASASSGNQVLGFTNTQRTNVAAVNTGLTNLRLYRPGYPTDGSVKFTSEFISAVQLTSVIRGMDFVVANSNNDQVWANRWLPISPGMPSATNPDYGSSWELLIALANAANRDVWLTVPVRANDAYITNLANLVKYGSDGVNPYTSVQGSPVCPPLAAGLNVYVEYGNEIWNSGGGFYGFYRTLDLSDAARAVASPYHPINYDGTVTADQYGAFRRYIAYRSSFISLAFRAVFGDAAMMTRVRPIFAAQFGNANDYLRGGLEWADKFYSATRSTLPPNNTIRKVSDLWYAGSTAPYYDSTSTPTDSTEPVKAAYFAGLPSPAYATGIRTDALWSKAYGLKLVSYEGGPQPGGLATGGGTGLSDADIGSYNLDPRIKDRMIAAQIIWDQSGGDEFTYYCYSGIGTAWSFVNTVTPNTVSDTNTPKLQALSAIAASYKASVTNGAAIPSTVYLRSLISSEQVYGDPASYAFENTIYQLRNLNDKIIASLNCTTARTYTFSLGYMRATAGATVEVLFNGVSAGSIVLGAFEAANEFTTPASSATVTAALQVGLVVVMLKYTGVTGDVCIRNLIVS